MHTKVTDFIIYQTLSINDNIEGIYLISKK